MPVTELNFNMRRGGFLTYEKPIREFPQDIFVQRAVVPLGPADTVFKANFGGMPQYCVGVRFLNLTIAAGDEAFIRVNGGGPRRILTGDVLSGCELDQLVVTLPVNPPNPALPAVGPSVILQFVGLGE